MGFLDTIAGLIIGITLGQSGKPSISFESRVNFFSFHWKENLRIRRSEGKFSRFPLDLIGEVRTVLFGPAVSAEHLGTEQQTSQDIKSLAACLSAHCFSVVKVAYDQAGRFACVTKFKLFNPAKADVLASLRIEMAVVIDQL